MAINKSKTLYAFDLDGTLLHSSAQMSEFTKDVLNRLIERGHHVTVATGRSESTVFNKISGVNIKLPIVLLNGVMVYNMQSRAYERVVELDKNCAELLLETISSNGVTGFVFVYENDDLNVYYENLDDESRKVFHDERSGQNGKYYKQIDSFSLLKERDIVYFVTSGERSHLESVRLELQNDKRFSLEFYSDMYGADDWFLEIGGVEASKFYGIKYLREKYGYDYVIAFGDNLNDIPLFKAADESYATANAKDELKAVATGIIGCNDDDAVAKWLEENILR